MTLLLTRARLRRNVPAAAIRELLAPSDHSKHVGAAHKLVWMLFADSNERERDFLWREEASGTYFLLSKRAPQDSHGMFDIDEPKEFAPQLARGDRLKFLLRANATVARKTEKDKRGKRSDVVMDALYRIPANSRAEKRRELVESSGVAWLRAQGERHGFTPLHDNGEHPLAYVNGYRTLRLDRSGSPATLGVLDFEGMIEVTDGATLLAGISEGFGRAKAFGCGLMLIRRAHSGD